MRLHGHHFQVIAITGAKRAGALRDTLLVPPGDSMTIVFDANNPGTWRCIAITSTTWRSA
jgi:FtsP/CotA-like multicopper oxidase with cupredoxin domain